LDADPRARVTTFVFASAIAASFTLTPARA